MEAQWVAERRGLSRFRSEQPPYSIFVRHIEHDVLPVAQAYGMGVLVWSPLARGWLTGRYRRESFDDSPEAALSRPALTTVAQPLVEKGLVVMEPDGIRVSPLGWYFVRAVAMVFDRHLQADRAVERFSRII